MALYFKNEKLKIYIGGVAYQIAATSMFDGMSLLSSDGLKLMDLNGIYLLPSDYISPVVDWALLSLDGYILKDSNGLYLTIKESE